MHKRFMQVLIIALAGLMLVSCANKETKEAPVTEGTTATNQGLTPDEMAAKTQGAAASAGFKGDELNNPNSPLSKRIIYFDYDSSEVKPEFRPIVEAHAGYLAAHPNTIVTLEGNTDERGSREYNLALGERRAQAVQKQMVLLGASADQIRTVSYGEERPANPGHDEAAYAQNRRVEIVYGQ